LRLLPALVPVVIVSGVAMIATAGPARVGGMSLFVLAVIFYVANWAAIAGLPQGMLGHAWSLSIEEQFYLVWPPVLALLLRRVRARWLLVAGLLLAALGSILLRYHLAVSGATGRRFYLGTDAHADPILIGCATACLVSWGYIRGGSNPSASTRWRWQAAALAAAAVLVAVLVMARLPDDYARRGASTIVAVAAGILIVDVLRPGSRLAPLLAWSPLVWIGKRSYALYLWHLPVFFLAGALWASGILEYLPSRIVPAWVITFAMAAASYRWIEAPALRLKSRFAARPADRTPVPPSLHGQGRPEIVVRFGEARPQPERFAEVRHRPRGIPTLRQHEAEAQMGIWIARPETDGLSQFRHRLLGPAVGAEGRAEVRARDP